MTQDKEDTKKDDEDGAGDNIFDNPVLPDDKDDRPTDAEDSLSDEEKEERAALNHTCDGITVSGVNLPWYVQFRVSSGDSYQFTNESDAMIFQSYEFELWDLKNNTEYEIPNGDYISVTVPVKSGYQYTIEHLLDNGATETIIPSVREWYYGIQHTFFQPVWNCRFSSNRRRGHCKWSVWRWKYTNSYTYCDDQWNTYPVSICDRNWHEWNKWIRNG